MQQKLIAEAFGTFVLALVVQLTLFTGLFSINTAVAAALTLGLFVYTIGGKSGCHINPAVTLGLLSIGKMKWKESVYYIISQLAGAGLATLLLVLLNGGVAPQFDIIPSSINAFGAEVVGAIIFGFGIAAVVYGKVRDDMSGIVIGLSLLIGLVIAVTMGSSGMLNPAVALALGAMDVSHVFGSVVGMALGMHLYRKFIA